MQVVSHYHIKSCCSKQPCTALHASIIIARPSITTKAMEREVITSTVISDNDHGALVVVVLAFCMVTSLVFLCSRAAIRWPWKDFFGVDDWATLVATVRLLISLMKTFADPTKLLGVVQGSLVFRAVSLGLGKGSQQSTAHLATNVSTLTTKAISVRRYFERTRLMNHGSYTQATYCTS